MATKKTKSKVKTKTKAATKKVAQKPKKTNKKQGIIIGGIFAGVVILGGIIGLIIGISSNFGDSASTLAREIANGKQVEIVKNAKKDVSFETFNNGLVSIQIPKGWKVEAGGDVVAYTVKVYDPENPDRMVFANLKTEGWNKSADAVAWQKRYYPKEIFAKMPYISPKTTEAFYKVFSDARALANSDPIAAMIPVINDFEVIENFGKSVFGGDMLRASFKNASGETIQGIFTATVKDPGTTYVAANIWQPLGKQVDIGILIVYDAFFFTAPDAEFSEWQEALDKSLGSLTYSEKFISEHAKSLKQTLETSKMISNYTNKVSEGIMDSWNKRQTSYDVSSQKRSDATLGYDRVVDTETGEVYKVTNGAMDHYDGTRYRMADRDDYLKAVTGTINLK